MTTELVLFLVAWMCLAVALGLLIGAAFHLGSEDPALVEDREVELLDSWWVAS